MLKQIVMKVPYWVDEQDVKDLVESYIEMKLPDSASREEYIDFLEINVDDIVEYPIAEEAKILKTLRQKAKKRCQY